MLTRRELHDGWTVIAAGGPVPLPIAGRDIPATVPGVIHTDLLTAALIPDPYLGNHEAALAWIGRSRWKCSLTFDWYEDDAARHDLVCDGLDTAATVRLNGTVLGEVANQHRRYRFDLRDVVTAGSNLLEIEFDSALEVAEAMAERLGARPLAYPHPYNMLRKSACNFGWDWGPDVVTAGIWRPIAIESWSGSRIDAVRASARADGTVTVNVDLERESTEPTLVSCEVAGVRTEATVQDDHARLELVVETPNLWWPRGYGKQDLYGLTVSTDHDQLRRRIGFRTVEIDATPDADGTSFGIRINGEPVFVRGANWIPDDAFPSRVDHDRYAARIRDAVEANANLLRVWGGGIYESEEFYAECDEQGLLVWQDFLFACAAYPEEEPLWSEVNAEARQAVGRLASHPSLVVWNGANENIWGHADWGWAEDLNGRSWGERYYRDLLPSIVAQLDPDRPYIPNSPFSWDPTHHPNDPTDGLMHIWDVWNQRDYTDYAAHRPRFVSEFGFQGPPAWSTLTRAVADHPLTPFGDQLMVHQKAADGQAKLARGLAPHLPEPRDFTDWHWATQLNQARAIRFGIEYFRSLAPYCQGAIVWQLNDCWPVVSWAAVDGDGIRKPLWFALRDAFADRLAMLTDTELVVVNDSPSAFTAEVQIARHTLDGTAASTQPIPLSVAARESARIPLPEGYARHLLGSGFVSVRGDGLAGTIRLDREPVDLGLAPAELRAEVVPTDTGYRVEITADSLVVDLCLFPDRLDPKAKVDHGMVTLLPGERVDFEVITGLELDPDALTSLPVLRTANDLFRS